MKVSKKLFVLPFLVFAMASCGKTPEDDSKDKEKDKPAEKTQVVIPQLYSGETGTTPLENFTYDGTEKHVHLEGVTSDKVEVKTESVFSATNAGEYSVVVSLKDTSKTCWKDKTTADKTFNWEIEKFNIAGSSDGFRLSVGSFVGESRDVTLSMNEEEVENPATLKLEFKLYNPDHEAYEWQEYEDATFTPETSNLSIDNDGKLVVSDTSDVGGLLVGTSNPNHTFSQHFSLSFFEYRTITFVAGDLTQETSQSAANGTTELVIDDTKLLPSEDQQKINFNYAYAPYGGGYTYLAQDLGYFENDFSTPIRSIKSIKVKGSYSRVGIKWGWSNGEDAINWRSYDDFFVDDPAEAFEFNNEKPNYFRVYALPFNNAAITEVQISFYDSVQESEDPYYEIDGLKYLKHAEYAECLGFAGASLADVVVQDSVGGVPVTTIAEEAFQDNSIIESIDLGESVRIVEPSAFRSTSHLTSIDGIENLTTIGDYSFYYCGVQGDIQFNSGLTRVGDGAFMNSHISSATFSDTGNPIVRTAAFRSITELESIHIGAEMTQYNDDLTFDYNLESITVGTGNTKYSSLDNVLLNDVDHVVVTFAGNRAETSFTVPSGYDLTTYCAYGNKTLEEIHFNNCSTVPDYSFLHCTNLRVIDFGSHANMTIKYAFANCTGLETLRIPSNVKTIYQRAFANCSSLASVEFDEGCTTINKEVFLNCTKLSHVILPTTLTHIGESGGWDTSSADVFYGCTALTTVLTRLELGESYTGTYVKDGWYGDRTLLFHSDTSDPNAWHVVNGAPTAYATRTLYIQSSSTFDVDGSWMAVWAWNTEYDGYFFYDHSAPVNYLYSIELPLNYRCVVILRMQAGVDASDYTTNFPDGKVHNQSPSFLLKATEDEATITDWGLDVSWGTHPQA